MVEAANVTLSLSSLVGLCTSLPPAVSLFFIAPYAYHLLAALHSVYSLWRRLGLRGLYKRTSGKVLGAMRSTVPGVGALIEQQVAKELSGIEKDMLGDGDADALLVLPAEATPASEVLARARSLRRADSYTAQHGKQWGGIYHHAESELTVLQSQVWAAYNTSNALYPQCFPSLRRFEAELISMTIGLLHGHEAGCVGLLSSGGTESVLLAALAYREHGRKVRGISHPQIVCGLSAHPAIVKACHYFGIELVKAPLDPTTMQLTAATVRPLLTSRTVAIYASAPSFSFGCVDAIEELGALAQSRGVGLHVDNCLGGYLLSFMQREGRFERAWDFAVPGVTTVSIDLHKYGYASKGVSVVAFRDAALRRLTYVPSADGCEGLYVTPTLQGSRGGAVMASAWATLLHLGEDGYRRSANQISDATEALKRAIRAMPQLKLCGDPTCAVVPMCGVGGLDVYALASLLESKGWGTFTGQKPATLALPVGDHTADHLDQMIEDLQASVAYLDAHPETRPSGTAAVYGAAAAIPDEVLEDVLRGYIDLKLKVKPAAMRPLAPDAHGADRGGVVGRGLGTTTTTGAAKRAPKSPSRKR